MCSVHEVMAAFTTSFYCMQDGQNTTSLANVRAQAHEVVLPEAQHSDSTSLPRNVTPKNAITNMWPFNNNREHLRKFVNDALHVQRLLDKDAGATPSKSQAISAIEDLARVLGCLTIDASGGLHRHNAPGYECYKGEHVAAARVVMCPQSSSHSLWML